MCYASPVMLRVPQLHPGHEQRGRGCCAISERPAPSSFASSSLLRSLSALFPLHPRNSPVSPLFPLLTQKQGGGGCLFSLSDLPSSVPGTRPDPVGLSGACPDPVGMARRFCSAFSFSPLSPIIPAPLATAALRVVPAPICTTTSRIHVGAPTIAPSQERRDNPKNRPEGRPLQRRGEERRPVGDVLAALRKIPDCAQHSLLHDEVHGLPEQPAHGARCQRRRRAATHARNQAALPVCQGFQGEAPKTFLSRLSRLQPGPIVRADHHKRTLWLHHRSDHAALPAKPLGRGEPYGLAGGSGLPSRHETFHPGHFASREIFEEGVAIEAAAVLPDLHQPGPDLLRGRLNGNRMRRLARVDGEQLVSGQSGASFRGRGAPMRTPATQPKVVDQPGGHEDGKKRESSAYEPLSHCVYLLWGSVR